MGVVYGFITQHAVRNHLRKEWRVAVHEMRGRRNPYFELDGDELVFAGLAGPELGREADGAQLLLELHMTAALVRALATRCAEAGVPFVVVYLPDGTQGPLAPLLSDVVGHDHLIDLRTRLDYAGLHFAHDSHLRPDGQARVADVLAPILARRLELQVAEPRRGE